jgi:F0F1-type ATP synthase assembly protein I
MTRDDRGAGQRSDRSAAPPKRKRSGSAAEFAGIGLQFALSILLFLFAGQWLDRRLGTGPWLMIVGMLIGGGAGFYSMYTKLMAAQTREDAARAARKAAGSGPPGPAT